MQVTLEIPDPIAEQLTAAGEGPKRLALEALAIEGYRSRRLSEFQIRHLLGFATRMDVHGFLKQHEAYLHYSLADLEQDDETARRVRSQMEAEQSERTMTAA
jgi:Uncharacterised protein family (UPF0175)